MPARRFSAESYFDKRARANLQHGVRDISLIPRQAACGRHSRNSDGHVGLTRSGMRASFNGVVTCGSVFACPYCSAAKQMARQIELRTLILTVQARGGMVVLHTPTLSRADIEALALRWDALTATMRRVDQDTPLRNRRKKAGLVSRVSVTHVTHSLGGWNPHHHNLDFYATAPSAETLEEIYGADGHYLRVLERASERSGLGKPSAAHQDYQVLGTTTADARNVAAYLTPAAADSAGKERRAGKEGLLPFDIARLALGDSDQADQWLETWHEFETAAHGQTQMRGLTKALDAFGITPGPDTVPEIDPTGTRFVLTDWRQLATSPLRQTQLLTALAGKGGWEAARNYCDDRGIETSTQIDPTCPCCNDLAKRPQRGKEPAPRSRTRAVRPNPRTGVARRANAVVTATVDATRQQYQHRSAALTAARTAAEQK